MDLGRFILGQWAPLVVQCMIDGEPIAPDAAPVVSVYSGATKVGVYSMPSVSPGDIDGLFVFNLFLDGDYSIGHYSAVVQYYDGSDIRSETMTFEIVDGGNVRGAVVSQTYYDRPQADFLVQRLSSDQRRLCKNPRGS